MGVGDNPWARLWKLNRDVKGILGGVKDREFRLKRIHKPGPRQYDFLYTAEDASNDPFADTVFTECGDALPLAPSRKLRRWKPSEDLRYLNLVGETFGRKNLSVLRLTGEKKVDGIVEWLTIFLIPNAIEWYPDSYRNLVYVTCRTSLRVRPDSLRRRLISLSFLQDGTAHGNPK